MQNTFKVWPASVIKGAFVFVPAAQAHENGLHAILAELSMWGGETENRYGLDQIRYAGFEVEAQDLHAVTLLLTRRGYYALPSDTHLVDVDRSSGA